MAFIFRKQAAASCTASLAAAEQSSSAWAAPAAPLPALALKRNQRSVQQFHKTIIQQPGTRTTMEFLVDTISHKHILLVNTTTGNM